MNREIIFRGKRVNNGEWVEGQYYKQNYCYGDPSVRYYIITSTEALDYDQALDYYMVDPRSVGQFTGLYDKNDKKIFEGDILSWEGLGGQTELVAVEYCNDRFIMRPIDKDANRIIMSLYVELNFVTVVGNIYDLNFTSEGSK